MKVAITSVIIFEVPDEPIYLVEQRFREANEVAIGVKMETISGQPWTMLKIERFDLERRD